MPKAMINGVLTDVSLDSLFQDDGTTPFGTPTPPPGAPSQTFTAADIERARQEEKDKLYGRIDGLNGTIQELQGQVGNLTKAEEQRLADAKAEKDRLDAEARAAEEKDLDAKSLVERRQQEWQTQLSQMQEQWNSQLTSEREARERTEALYQRERELNEVGDYARTQVEANKDKIAPQLLGWITGSTKEEIDAQIKQAVETTDAILADIQSGQQQMEVPGQPPVYQVPGGQPPVPAPPAPPALPGTRVTAAPGADPATQYQQLTAEQIQNMPLDQYAKIRPQLIRSSGDNRGLFG